MSMLVAANFMTHCFFGSKQLPLAHTRQKLLLKGLWLEGCHKHLCKYRIRLLKFSQLCKYPVGELKKIKVGV